MSDDDGCDIAYESGRILVGSCVDRLADLADASVDSIVTDPPYELGFMGKRWDASNVAYSVELWRQCLRVLKPGGHLLAFGGTRTYHRMTVAIEDAGFEIRDCIHWMYGSGFPKSLDVSKAIDKQRHDRNDVYRVTAWIRAARDAAGLANRDIDGAFGLNGMAGHWTSNKSQPAVPTLDQVPLLLDVLGVKTDDVPDDIRRLLWDLNGPKGKPNENWWKRQVIGAKKSGIANKSESKRHTIGASTSVEVFITSAATDASRQWEGWGTALKPAHEPIVVARKPLNSTVAANVLEHGTGALNIHGCRVAALAGDEPLKCDTPRGGIWRTDITATATATAAGRWPANIVLTHAADCGDRCAEGCPVAALDDQQDGASRFFTVTDWDVPAFLYVAKASTQERNAGLNDFPAVRHADRVANDKPGGDNPRNYSNTPSQNFHPTVKPVALMRHLVRLVTPPGGILLDPFLGSGTTAVAAVLEGFQWVGCEITADYLPIIDARVRRAETERHNQPPTLFDWSEYE